MAAFLRILLKVESFVAAVSYALVAILLLGEIVAREVFAETIWGSQKMAVFAAIYAGFMGLTLATAANSHLRPQFADNWWPVHLHRAVERFGDVLSCLIFWGLGLSAISYVGDSYLYGDRAAVLYNPLWWIQVVIPYALFSSGLRHFAFALQPALKPKPSLLEA